jgi:hypothetical protein
VVRVGWRCIESDVRFGLRVLLWRWRWVKAWEMTVYREMFMPKGSRKLERLGIQFLQFGEGWTWDEGDNLCKMMVRELRDEREVGGPLWEGVHGELAWLSLKDFEREVWVFWCVELYRVWEARFTPGGRRRRAEARWRGDRKVGRVWWRWGRRKGGPPSYPPSTSPQPSSSSPLE